MKTLTTLIVWSFLLTATNSWSQSRIDFMIGISPESKPKTAQKLINRQFPLDEFRLGISRIRQQFYLGLNANMSLRAPFFAEAGLIYTQRKSDYIMRYTYKPETDPSEIIMPESEHMLLLPVSIGVSIGKVDVTSGFSLTGTLSKESSMSQVIGYLADEPFLRLGWHAGVRHTFGRSMIGVQYQSSFNRTGTGTTVNGESLELRHIPGQFVLTAHFRFAKK